MMNFLHNLPAGPDAPDLIFTLVEVPAKSRNKYKYDIKREIFILDKVLHAPFSYPVDYGFIPSTWYDDSAPLDVILLVFESTFTGCIVRSRPIGLLRMKGESGIDDKILAVPNDEPRFNPTLLQLLRQDFALEIQELAGELPTDDSGLDI